MALRAWWSGCWAFFMAWGKPSEGCFILQPLMFCIAEVFEEGLDLSLWGCWWLLNSCCCLSLKTEPLDAGIQSVPSHSPELLRRTGREPGEASRDPSEQQG